MFEIALGLWIAYLLASRRNKRQAQSASSATKEGACLTSICFLIAWLLMTGAFIYMIIAS